MSRLLLALLAAAWLTITGCGGPAPSNTAAPPLLGPRPDVVLVRGPIDTTEPSAFTVRDATGTQRIDIDDKTGFGILANSRLDSIRPGEFVGITSERLPNGALQAVEVHIFPESQRGAGEGYYPWDLPRPGGATMTNATVTDVVQRVDGPVLTLTPHGQTIQIMVPSAAPIVRIEVRGAADVLRVGYGTVVVAQKAPDGRRVARQVYTGEGGAMPAF